MVLESSLDAWSTPSSAARGLDGCEAFDSMPDGDTRTHTCLFLYSLIQDYCSTVINWYVQHICSTLTDPESNLNDANTTCGERNCHLFEARARHNALEVRTDVFCMAFVWHHCVDRTI